MNEVYIFFAAAVAVFLFAVVTFTVVLSYHKALKEKKVVEEELAAIKKTGSTEAQSLLTKAHSDALEVIKNAELKAQELLQASQIFSEEYKTKFQASVSSTVGAQVQTEMKVFHDTMVAESMRMGESLNKSLVEANAIAKKEIEEYKKQMLANINLVIFKIVQDATKKSLAESITREQHEKIIVKALEEAKAQNVL